MNIRQIVQIIIIMIEWINQRQYPSSTYLMPQESKAHQVELAHFVPRISNNVMAISDE